MWRVEDKYVCSGKELLILQTKIRGILREDDNQCNNSGYCITSIYFDDFYDSAYKDTVDGNAVRRKYRIRIYNGSLKNIKLEVKDKRYNRVRKKSQLITEEQMHQLLSGQQIGWGQYDMESPVGLFNLAMIQNGLRPKIIVEYDRKAYVYQPGNVRITFDTNIRVSDQTARFGTDQITYYYLEEPNDVLEIKYDDFLPQFIAQTLETGNMIQTSYSKYMLSRERNCKQCQQKM